MRDTNGFQAFKAHEIIHAGHEHLGNSIDNADNAFIPVKLDKRLKDRNAIGKPCYISTGPLKGYRGKVFWADETHATVEVFAKRNQRVTLLRD